MNKDMSTALFCDCETDADRAEFFASGRAVETGVIAPSIAAEVAQAFAAHAQLAEKEREIARMASLLSGQQLESLDWKCPRCLGASPEHDCTYPDCLQPPRAGE